MDYEKKLNELEELVKKLENGNVTLEESVSLFESGVALTKDCILALKEYKGRITSASGEMDKLLKDAE